MEITLEILQAIYMRAEQYSIAKFGKKPDGVELSDYGGMYLLFTDNCGDTDREYVTISELTADLEEIAAKRREAEEEEARRLQKLREEQRERQLLREKQERFQYYIQLKREFETPENPVLRIDESKLK